jgi:hypothetical protein
MASSNKRRRVRAKVGVEEERQETMFFERRATPSYAVERNAQAVLFSGAHQFLGRVVEISEGGVRFALSGMGSRRLRSVITVGAPLDLLIKPDLKAYQCNIRHFEGDTVGLSFIDKASRSRTRELLSRLTA